VSGGGDGLVRIWEFARGKSVRVLNRHQGTITSLDVSPDGRFLASGSGDCTARLWSFPQGKALATLTEHRDDPDDTVLAVAFSPHGALLATSGTDGMIFLWSAPEGKLLKRLRIHTGSANALRFTSDGKFLISAGGEYAVQLWRIPSGRLYRTFDGAIGERPILAQSQAGDIFATARGGGTELDPVVRVWSSSERAPVCMLETHQHAISSLIFAPDGSQLFGGSGDGLIRTWSAETARLAHLPASQISLLDLNWIQATLKRDDLSAAERQALAFIEAHQRWRRRSDIMVGEAQPRVIEVGEFDIQLEES
jgi:WD40 repeat protein